MRGVDLLAFALVLPIVLWLGSKAVFYTYFKAKEDFVDRLVHKGKVKNADD